MAGYLTVWTTTDAPEKARELAAGAVEARVAACAQVVETRDAGNKGGEKQRHDENEQQP